MKATPFFLPLALAIVSSLPSPAQPAQTNRPNLDLVRQLNEAFVQVAETVSPAVVVLRVTEKSSVVEEPAEKDSAEQEEYWRRFHREFNDEPNEGQGSGILIRKDGYILTNGHVIEDAEKIQVRLLDGRTFTAKVHGVDKQSDVAVLKIDADNLPVAKLGDSTKVRVGEFAIAIGAPFSLDYTVTYGHISAKSRANVIPFFLGGQTMDQDFFQTDANINPGNSGGPLINIEGEVIGVNTLIRGLRTGIGFAIPINLARDVADQLITNGRFIRPWLGIEIRALQDEPELLEITKDIRNGVVVRSVLPHGPASKSDLRAGDIIAAVDGKQVSTPQQLRGELRGKRIGQNAKLTVYRGGKIVEVNIQLGEFKPAEAVFAENTLSPKEPHVSSWGISVRTLSPAIAGQLQPLVSQGVVVTAVETNSPALRNDIKPGDVITAVNHTPITSSTEFSDAVRKADLKKGVLLNLIRDGAARFEILKESKD